MRPISAKRGCPHYTCPRRNISRWTCNKVDMQSLDYGRVYAGIGVGVATVILAVAVFAVWWFFLRSPELLSKSNKFVEEFEKQDGPSTPRLSKQDNSLAVPNYDRVPSSPGAQPPPGYQEVAAGGNTSNGHLGALKRWALRVVQRQPAARSSVSPTTSMLPVIPLSS